VPARLEGRHLRASGPLYTTAAQPLVIAARDLAVAAAILLEVGAR